MRANPKSKVSIKALLEAKAAGDVQGTCRLQLLPGWSAQELTISATPATGQAVTRTYTKDMLAALGTGTWVDISTGPVAVSGAGPVVVKVLSKEGDCPSNILFDEIRLE